MTSLESVLRNRPRIVFEHVYDDKSITQLVCIEGKIYERPFDIKVQTKWGERKTVNDLSRLFFKRANPQPTDLPQVENKDNNVTIHVVVRGGSNNDIQQPTPNKDKGLSGQALVDALRTNPNVEYYCEATKTTVFYDGERYLIRDSFHTKNNMILPSLILSWWPIYKFFRVEQSKQEEQVDPVKLLHDNPDVVFVTHEGQGYKFRCHDFRIQWFDSSINTWQQTTLSNTQLRDKLKNLIRYNPQEDLKKKLEAVKLPEGFTFLGNAQNNIHVNYKGRLFINHVSSITDLTNAIQDLRDDLVAAETRVKLLNVLIEHEKQNKQ